MVDCVLARGQRTTVDSWSPSVVDCVQGYYSLLVDNPIEFRFAESGFSIPSRHPPPQLVQPLTSNRYADPLLMYLLTALVSEGSMASEPFSSNIHEMRSPW